MSARCGDAGDEGSRAGEPAANGPGHERHRSELLIERIVDAMADPLFVKDEQHRWIIVNRAFCEFMGHSREEIVGKSDFDFFPEEEAATFWKKDQEVFETGGVNENEEPFTDAAGQTYIIVTKKTVFTDAEGRRILVGTIRDITELKRAQEALRKARDELELRVARRTREVEETQAHLRQAQKMQAVGQLTGGIAHDFNNLLTVIVGNLELALPRVEADGELRELVEQSLRAAGRGATLTQRLLAFSRRQALQPRPTDVAALIENMVDILQRTLGQAIAVEVRREAEVACSRVDPAQLETALLNLAINARDAMPRGGRLNIDTSLVGLAGGDAEQVQLSAGRYVLVEITDTGTGMDEDTLERVFEPFFTTKAVAKGSGLGLSMVYGFVSQTGGHVSISSAEERGTTVKVLLPAHPEPPEALETRVVDVEVVPKGAGESVLVVEDDPNVRRLAVMMLRGLGYGVHEAGSAVEALELVPTLSRLDLLLTDVILAGGSGGPELATQLLQERPELNVLLMSGYVANSLEGPRAGEAFALLDKPFRRVELARAVRRALD